MITIQKTKSDLPQVNQDLIRKAVKDTLLNFSRIQTDITIRLTNDNEIAQLNKHYRNISSPTDVLSFNQNYQDPETGRNYLGDIVISLETAKTQAPKYNLSLDQECAFLAIHGTLHLLGYDHATAEEKTRMWEIQEKILNELIKDSQKKEG